MKKIISICLCVILAIGLLTACGDTGTAEKDRISDPIRIVTTIFPVYDWVREVLGDRAPEAELTMLLDSGVDLHSFEPTAADIRKIANCDLFIYVGGESDEWVDDALKQSVNPDMQVIDLLKALGDRAKEEEVVEGMEAEEALGEEENEDVEYDEHVWISLRNAQELCGVIAGALADIDPAGADAYRENADAYSTALRELDARYAEAVAAAPVHTVLFGDRFPFRYMADDYGLDYYAAFSGCAAETEASFETIVFLAGKVDELGLGAILQIESSDGGIARTIRDSTRTGDQAILTLNSLQSVTAVDAAEGVAYITVMEENLDILTAALGR